MLHLKSLYLFAALRFSLLACACCFPCLIYSVSVEDIFEIEHDGYYIKRKYYTEENIRQGREFFEVNCAVCHGTEADGSGPRADVMQDAKPRMLTNLDWINTRDDLRLLRSIKYGVPGTAMTPWGDFSSSEQRLQLVIFIRSLTATREKQDQLASALYQTFESEISKIENARIKENNELSTAQVIYDKAKKTHQELLEKARSNPDLNQEILKQYEQELIALDQLEKRKKSDAVYEELKELIKKESLLYRDIGLRILSTPHTDPIFNDFIAIIETNKNRFSITNGHLKTEGNTDVPQAEALQKALISFFNQNIELLQQKKKRLESKIQTPGVDPNMVELNNEINEYTKLKNAFIAAVSQARRLREQQQALLTENF